MKRRRKGQKRKHARVKHKMEYVYIPEETEEKWKDDFWRVKSFDMHLSTDIDRDGIIDAKDCRPFDPTRQDAITPPTRPDFQRPRPDLPPTIRRELATPRTEKIEAPLGPGVRERVRSPIAALPHPPTRNQERRLPQLPNQRRVQPTQVGKPSASSFRKPRLPSHLSKIENNLLEAILGRGGSESDAFVRTLPQVVGNEPIQIEVAVKDERYIQTLVNQFGGYENSYKSLLQLRLSPSDILQLAKSPYVNYIRAPIQALPM